MLIKSGCAINMVFMKKMKIFNRIKSLLTLRRIVFIYEFSTAFRRSTVVAANCEISLTLFSCITAFEIYGTLVSGERNY